VRFDSGITQDKCYSGFGASYDVKNPVATYVTYSGHIGPSLA
jgi:hypothetical protein